MAGQNSELRISLLGAATAQLAEGPKREAPVSSKLRSLAGRLVFFRMYLSDPPVMPGSALG
jgi:hypothetical protein